MRYLFLFAAALTALFTVSVLTWKRAGKPPVGQQSSVGVIAAGLLTAVMSALWLYLFALAAWAGWQAIRS